MPRGIPSGRLAELAEAATRVFGKLGYRRARTADVAAEAGMSSGSVFTYVESKEALFHLVFTHGFGRLGEDAPRLPLATPAPGDTVRLIQRGLAEVDAPRMRAALKERAPRDIGAELSGIVEERYRALEALWPLLAVIERSAVDLPELEALYFRRVRRGYLDQLERYLAARTSAGYLRSMSDPVVRARIVTETIVWFAWHRHEGRDAALFDDDRTRQTVVEFVVAALLEPER